MTVLDQSPPAVRVARDATRVSALLAVAVAQVGLAVPAVLAGLFQTDLGTTSAELTWISDMFMVPVTLLELSSSVLGDLFGRKRLLVGGAVALALGEAISMLTPGAGVSSGTRVLVLCGGQALAGAGGAALFATSLAMVVSRARGAEERTRSIAVWAVALATGGFVSPVVGGLTGSHRWFADQAASGWRWTFLAVVLLALVSAVTSAVLAEDSRSPEGRSLDVPGQVAIAVGLFALLFAVIQGPTSGWGSAPVIAGFVAAAVLLPVFLVVEHRAAAPLLQLGLFSNRAYALSALVTVVGMFAFLGTAYATSVRLAAVQGLSPLQVSVAFVLLSGMALVLAKVTPGALVRYQAKWVLGGGLVLVGVGDAWMATLSSSSSLALAQVVAPLAIVGVGFAFAVSSVTEVAVASVPARLTGMASGSNNLFRNLGFTLGPPVVGAVSLTLAASRLHAALAASPSLQKALAAFGGLAAKAPPAEREAVHSAIAAVSSGPLGANAVPATTTVGTHVVAFNPVKEVAFHALSHGFAVGYVVCAVAAGVAAVLVVAFLRPAPRPGARGRAGAAQAHRERTGGSGSSRRGPRIGRPRQPPPGGPDLPTRRPGPARGE